MPNEVNENTNFRDRAVIPLPECGQHLTGNRSYAAEFGRMPGGQISILTRSGSNQFHGTAFEYFRNDVLDASDWFSNANHLPKPEERQNDFGGVFGGPILKDKTFFFFSYEGLRLRQPATQETVVPDTASRQQAPATMQPYLNAYLGSWLSYCGSPVHPLTLPITFIHSPAKHAAPNIIAIAVKTATHRFAPIEGSIVPILYRKTGLASI